jgi:hypothetical protein
MTSSVEVKAPKDDVGVTEEELRSRDYITPADVLNLKHITNGSAYFQNINNSQI